MKAKDFAVDVAVLLRDFIDKNETMKLAMNDFSLTIKEKYPELTTGDIENIVNGLFYQDFNVLVGNIVTNFPSWNKKLTEREIDYD